MSKIKGKLERKNSKRNKFTYSKDEFTKIVIMGLVGLILVIVPDAFNKVVGIIVGLILLLIGLSNIYNYIHSRYTNGLITGILFTLLGIIIIISPGSVIRSIAIVVGFILVITGLSKVRLSFTLKQSNFHYFGTLLIGILTTILGLILIFSPFSGAALTKFAGLFLIIVAVFDLIDNYILQK